MSLQNDLTLLRRSQARVLHIVEEEHFRHLRWCRRCRQYFEVEGTSLFCAGCRATLHDLFGRTLDAPFIAGRG